MGWETDHDDWWHHGQCRDAEFLKIFQHLHEVEFWHDVDWNATSECTRYVDSLRHRMIEREKAQPFPANCEKGCCEVGERLTSFSSDIHDPDAKSINAHTAAHSPHNYNA